MLINPSSHKFLTNVPDRDVLVNRDVFKTSSIDIVDKRGNLIEHFRLIKDRRNYRFDLITGLETSETDEDRHLWSYVLRDDNDDTGYNYYIRPSTRDFNRADMYLRNTITGELNELHKRLSPGDDKHTKEYFRVYSAFIKRQSKTDENDVMYSTGWIVVDRDMEISGLLSDDFDLSEDSVSKYLEESIDQRHIYVDFTIKLTSVKMINMFEEPVPDGSEFMNILDDGLGKLSLIRDDDSKFYFQYKEAGTSELRYSPSFVWNSKDNPEQTRELFNLLFKNDTWLVLHQGTKRYRDQKTGDIFPFKYTVFLDNAKDDDVNIRQQVTLFDGKTYALTNHSIVQESKEIHGLNESVAARLNKLEYQEDGTLKLICFKYTTFSSFVYYYDVYDLELIDGE